MMSSTTMDGSSPQQVLDNRKRAPLMQQGSDVVDATKRLKKTPGVLATKGSPQFKLYKLTDKDRERTHCEIRQNIDLCPVAAKFYDSPQFQRLHYIKQLGTSYRVYDSANHTRFEHSLGVMDLANNFCLRIKNKQPYLGTTDKDVLCITLAGLLHDIGHGPFSHIYEVFRGELADAMKDDPSMEKAYSKFLPVDGEWAHEDSSLMMIDAALKWMGLAIDWENLDKPLKQVGDGVDARSMRVFNHTGGGFHNNNKGDVEDVKVQDEILTSRDLIFIKECIWGGKPLRETKKMIGRSELVGRTSYKKQWLYEIVANRFSGLDVDKMDYFARDKRRALGEAGVVNIPVLVEPLVAKASCPFHDCPKCVNGRKGHLMICFPWKCRYAVWEFFATRTTMHQKVYQHKATVAAAYLICDILRAADLHHLLTDDKESSEPLPISRAFLNPNIYEELDDSILTLIRKDKSEKMTEARALAQRYFKRILYKMAGTRVINMKNPKEAAIWKKEKRRIVDEILSIQGKHNAENGESIRLVKNDVIIDKSSVHYGCKDQNPLKRVRFFENADTVVLDTEATELDECDYPIETPAKFQKNSIRVFCRDPDPAKVDLLAHVFNAWKLQEVQLATPSNDVEHLQHEEFDAGEMDDDDDGFGGGGGFGGSRMLTQEDPEEQESDDDDEGITPYKPRRNYNTDPSPIPLHR